MNKTEKHLIETFLKSVASGLYPNIKGSPSIEFFDEFDGDEIEIDLEICGQSPGRMIGRSAQFRFALETIIEAATGREWKIYIKGCESGPRGGERGVKQGQPPTTETIDEVVTATVNLLGGTKSATEKSDTCVVAICRIDEEISDRVKPALNRIVRSVGKTRGFPAMAFVTDA